MSKATTTRKVDYFRLPRDPYGGGKSRSACPGEKEVEDEARGQAEGLRSGCRQRHLVRALERLPVEGSSSGLVRGVLKCYPRTFPEMEADGPL